MLMPKVEAWSIVRMKHIPKCLIIFLFLYSTVLVPNAAVYLSEQQSFNPVVLDTVKISCSSGTVQCSIDSSIPISFSVEHKTSRHHTTGSRYNLDSMSAEQLIWFFITHNYTQEQILTQPLLYLRSAYLAVAKQLPKYPQYVKMYHDEYKKLNWFTKGLGRMLFIYTPKLQRQFAMLWRECEENRIAQEKYEQEKRELQVKKQQEANDCKTLEKREAYVRELERVENIVCDGSACKRLAFNNHKARLNAIKKSKQHFERILRKLQTSKDVIAFAQQYGITEQQIACVTLNSYEYQLHKEFVSHIHSALAFKRNYNITDPNIFIDALGSGISLGIKSNHLHNPEWATRWSDFCYEATEIVQGIGEGILLGSYNTVDMVAHPVHTLVRMVDGVRMLGALTARTVGALVHLNYLIERGKYLQCATEVYGIGEQLVEIAATIQESTAKMSNRDIAKHVTVFGTEWVLTGQMFLMGHALCSNLGHTIKRTIKFLKDEGTAGEFALATTDGMLLKASENMNKGGGRGVNNLIRSSNTLLETVHAEYMAKLKTDIDILRIAFDCKVNGFASFANKWIKINYEHILGMEELAWGRYGLAKINGFHHDCMNIIRKSGALEFIDQVVTETGFYKSKILYDGHYVDTKTFFPANWPREKVVSTIYDAYNNFIKSGVKPKQLPDGKLILQGLTNEGVTIEMIMTQKCKIVTAYPLL